MGILLLFLVVFEFFPENSIRNTCFFFKKVTPWIWTQDLDPLEFGGNVTWKEPADATRVQDRYSN